MRTLQLVDLTTIVVRQIAAVGPLVHREEDGGEDETLQPLPPKKWCYFEIWLVGGSKMYPSLQYSPDGIQCARDRNKIIAALETRLNEL